MIPAIVEQYIEKLLNKSVRADERENCRFVIVKIRDACDKALITFDGRRSN